MFSIRELSGSGGRIAGLRFSSTVVVGVLVTACFSYQPVVAMSGPRAGEQLRLQLTHQGTEELTRYLGPRVTALDGELVRVEADSALELRISTLHFVDGTSFPFNGEDLVPVARPFIASTTRRTLSPMRSVVASAGVVAGLIVLASAALHTGHVSPGGGPPGPPPP